MYDSGKLNLVLRAATVAGLTGALVLGPAGCKGNTGSTQTASSNGGDPADANLAQPYTGGATGGYTNTANSGQPTGGTRVLAQSQSASSQSTGESYESQSPAPIIRQESPSAGAPTQYYPVPQASGDGASYNGQGGSYAPDPATQGGNYTDAEAAGEQALAETDQAPPPLPEYDQPPAPADNYIWNPGYWNYASTGYYFVPGIWCAPPFYGALWTPPYWGYYNNRYLFHRGYWGQHIGYYGGINYGFGYIGTGYYGGYWRGHDFFYNRAVTNVNVVNVHNVYQRTVVYNNQTYGARPLNRISYNGGPGGLRVQPRPEEVGAMHEAHYAPLPVQQQNRLAAASSRSQFFAANAGRPAQAFAGRPFGTANNIPTTPREGAFNHGAAPGNPAFNGRPTDLGRPSPVGQPASTNARANLPGQPAMRDNRPAGFDRAATPNQPTLAGSGRGQFNRPGTPVQPAYNNNQARELNRQLAPNQPGANTNRPAEFNRAGESGQPASNNGRSGPNQPSNSTQPASTSTYTRSAAPAYTRPAAPAQPTYTRPENLNRPGGSSTQPTYNNNGRQPDTNRSPVPNQPGTAQPRATYARPVPQPQPAPTSQPNPGLEGQRSYRPQAQPQNRPDFESGRPNPQAAEPQYRPNPAETRPAPSFTPTPRPPQPQISAPHSSAPAPAAPHVEAPQSHPTPAVNPHPH